MSVVMRGLDPRIHRTSQKSQQMDCRVKPGNDEAERKNTP
jgi:hypothetical protein